MALFLLPPAERPCQTHLEYLWGIMEALPIILPYRTGLGPQLFTSSQAAHSCIVRHLGPAGRGQALVEGVQVHSSLTSVPLPISGYRYIYPSSDNLSIYTKGATSHKCHSRGSWEGAPTPASYFPPFPKALLIHHAEKVPRVRTEGLPPLSLTSKWSLQWSSGTSSGRNVGVP